MALKAGPKSQDILAPDLNGLPWESPARELAALERWGIDPYGWQAELLPILTAHDRPRLAYVQVPRKNGKTRLAAMVALLEIILKEARHVYAVSDSERNLHSVLWLEICQLLNDSPALRDRLYVFKNRLENPHNGSFLELRPGNFKASQGINPHLVLADEVHLIKPEVWNGYQMSIAARDDPLLLGTTTPGYALEGIAYDLCLTARDGLDPDLFSRIYEPEDVGCDANDEEAWEQANPILRDPRCPRGFLAGMRYDVKHSPENEFRRFRLGQWTSTKEAWLPNGVYERGNRKRKLKPGERVWLAFDGSYSGDSTALVACTADEFLAVVGHWQQEDASADAWRIDVATVEEAIRQACKLYQVVEIVGDPYRWSRSLQALAAEGLPVMEFPQTPARMIPATAGFYDAMMDDRITHDEEEAWLGAHLRNCVTRRSAAGVMVSKDTKTSNRRIDLAVAAIMAHSRAARAEKPATTITVNWF